MTQIEILFSREMAIAAIEGRKIATTRNEKKGEIGDVFEIWHPDIPKKEACKFFATPKFRLIDIQDMPLSVVCCRWFRLEGFDSPEAFEKTWRSLHRGHFTTGKTYYIHFFTRVV